VAREQLITRGVELKIGYLLMIIVTLQTPRFFVTAYKQGHPSFAKEIQNDLEVYIDEANYPDDYNLKEIAKDLRITLELDDCTVSPLD